jgi:hypothetical protein
VVRGTVRKRGSLPALVAALAVSLAAASAGGETLTLRWRHAAPERVTGFRVHTGRAPGVYTRTVDVGKPAPDAAGLFRVSVEVPDGEATHVAVSAYDAAGAQSARSNEWTRPSPAAALGTPGRPQVVEP